MRNLILAAAGAAALLTGFTAAADAGVKIYLGAPAPYYSDQYEPDYNYGPEHRYRQSYDDLRYRPSQRARLSCSEARRAVRNSGFRNVSARDCSGRTYTFSATRNGRRILVYVNARTGSVSRG